MNAALFLGYTLAVAGGVVAAGLRWLPRQAALWLALGLATWLAWVGWHGASGMLAEVTRLPPVILYMAAPFAGFVLLLSVSRFGETTALAFPLPLLLGAQTFRVGVEWLLHRLWQDGLAPRLLTFEGANFDILVGLTAPLAAWAATRGKTGAWFALAWSVLGLAMLANVVIRAVLTAPGGLNLITTEIPNRLPRLFPYSYLAGFLAPLALLLHVLAIRALRQRLQANLPTQAA